MIFFLFSLQRQRKMSKGIALDTLLAPPPPQIVFLRDPSKTFEARHFVSQ